jgi:hypothetical protein
MSDNATKEFSSKPEKRGPGFIKLMRTDEINELLRFPFALALLVQIALRARWTVDQFNPHNLKLGEALIGDYQSIGATRQQYRTARRQLVEWGVITIRVTIKGTIARLSNLRVFDINEQPTEQPPEQPLTRIQDVQEPKMSKKTQGVQNPMVNESGGNVLSEAAAPAAPRDIIDVALELFNGKIVPPYGNESARAYGR